MIARLFQGLALTVLFPTIGAITSQWATEHEHGLFIAVLTGYIQLSSIFSTPVSASVGTHLGWPSIFYLHAGVCAFTTLLWLLLHRNTPIDHPLISSREYDEILAGKDTVDCKQPIPYKQIFSSLPVWAVWVAVMGHMFAAQFTVTFLPMYLSWAIGFSVASAGTISAVPLVVQLILKFATGVLSDRLTSLSELAK
uniref:MFS domain-containing protein n=1 Tax=Steinernema glaseri TaxID=37863 RepID=A0A1I7YRW6_9BILA